VTVNTPVHMNNTATEFENHTASSLIHELIANVYVVLKLTEARLSWSLIYRPY